MRLFENKRESEIKLYLRAKLCIYLRNRMKCLRIRPWDSSFSPLRRERPVFGPKLSPVYGYVGLFSKWQSDQRVNLTTHIHVVLILKMSEFIPSILHISLWRAERHNLHSS